MRVLLTGASGFLGNYISKAMSSHSIDTFGRSEKSTIRLDLAKAFKLDNSYDMVIHCAGLAHIIPKSEEEVESFKRINSEGTINLLNAFQKPPKVFVFISSVAVYGLDTGESIDENVSLCGNTPYAKSKIEAERIVSKWCKEENVELLILRLPLICGLNPPGNLHSMMKAIKRGLYVRIGVGSARKSMVSAEDVAKLIASPNLTSGIYNLTDGIHPTIKDTDSHISKLFGKSVRSLPTSLISTIAKVGDVVPFFPLNSLRFNKLNSSLTFSDKRAREHLNWNPEPALNSLSFVDEK